MTARTKAYLLLLLTAIIWGWASPVIKYTTNYLPPFVFLLYRFFLSSLVALVFLPSLRRHLPKSPYQWIITLLYGFIVTTLTLGLLFIGANYSSALVSAVSSAVQPLMASVAGVIFLHEHLTRKEKAGITLAFFGSLLITFEPLLKSGLFSGSLFGNLLLIGSRVTDTISSLVAKPLLRAKISPAVLTHVSFITGFFTLLPFVLFSYSPHQLITTITSAPLSAHLGAFYMAFISGTLAYTLWHIAERSIEVGEATVSYYLHPLTAAPLAIIWLHEQLTPIYLIGCIVIFAGVGLAQYRRSLTFKPARPSPRSNPSKRLAPRLNRR